MKVSQSSLAASGVHLVVHLNSCNPYLRTAPIHFEITGEQGSHVSIHAATQTFVAACSCSCSRCGSVTDQTDRKCREGSCQVRLSLTHWGRRGTHLLRWLSHRIDLPLTHRQLCDFDLFLGAQKVRVSLFAICIVNYIGVWV